jgi:hypothetical protein
MAIIVHTDSGSGTTSGGTFSKNVIARNNILSHIFVKAATGGTTFDVKLVDIYDNEMYLREDNTGELNETSVKVPTYGNYTFTIENSSADEAFDFNLVFEES